MAKRGALTKAEKEEILSLAGKMTPAVIAAKLDRNPDTVRAYIDSNYVPPGVERSEAQQETAFRNELKSTRKWTRLQREFSEEELEFFEEAYFNYYKQFKGDLLPTEETQLFQAVKLDIINSRNLIARKQAIEDIERIQKEQRRLSRQLEGTTFDPVLNDQMVKLESTVAAIRQAEVARHQEYGRMQELSNKLIDKLKGAREQRIKEVESGKVSFLGLIKALQQRETADKEGRQAELMRMAAEKEYHRLSQPHTFADEGVDLPILSSDSLELQEEDGGP